MRPCRIAVDQAHYLGVAVAVAAMEEVAPVAGCPDRDVDARVAELNVAVGWSATRPTLRATDKYVVPALAQLDVVAEDADEDIVAGAAELDVGVSQALVGRGARLNEGVGVIVVVLADEHVASTATVDKVGVSEAGEGGTEQQGGRRGTGRHPAPQRALRCVRGLVHL